MAASPVGGSESEYHLTTATNWVANYQSAAIAYPPPLIVGLTPLFFTVMSFSHPLGMSNMQAHQQCRKDIYII